jgi:hypothetical protein
MPKSIYDTTPHFCINDIVTIFLEAQTAIDDVIKMVNFLNWNETQLKRIGKTGKYLKEMLHQLSVLTLKIQKMRDIAAGKQQNSIVTAVKSDIPN